MWLLRSVLLIGGYRVRGDLSVFVEKFPFIAIESVCFNRTESAGVIAPVVFDRGAELRIAVSSVRSFEILVIRIEYFWAVARL